MPGVPAPKSAPAIALFALGLVVYGALAVRATNTFLLTRRAADFAVVLGIVLLACSLYGALILSFMDLGWWLGHIFELAGLVVVGSSLVFDLRRGRRSRALVGDLRAAELVASEEAYLGARVRALTVRLAVKDASTEEHTRRVATLAVQIGETLGLSPTRLRSLAIGGLLHDIGKLSIPDAILQKPGPLDDDEYDVVKQHPERGRELLNELGGFDDAVGRARARPSRAARRQRLPARARGRRARPRRHGSSRSATSTTRSSRGVPTGRRGRASRH